jgi:hypothetical protein
MTYLIRADFSTENHADGRSIYFAFYSNDMACFKSSCTRYSFCPVRRRYRARALSGCDGLHAGTSITVQPSFAQLRKSHTRRRSASMFCAVLRKNIIGRSGFFLQMSAIGASQLSISADANSRRGTGSKYVHLTSLNCWRTAFLVRLPISNLGACLNSTAKPGCADCTRERNSCSLTAGITTNMTLCPVGDGNRPDCTGLACSHFANFCSNDFFRSTSLKPLPVSCILHPPPVWLVLPQVRRSWFCLDAMTGPRSEAAVAYAQYQHSSVRDL